MALRLINWKTYSENLNKWNHQSQGQTARLVLVCIPPNQYVISFETTNFFSGLGLAVVARIVEQLGGQLRVESTVGKGSQFSLLIPLSLNIGRSSSQGPSSLSSGSSRGSPVGRSLTTSRMSGRSPGHNIDSLVSALSSNHMASPSRENLRSNIEEARVAEGMFHPLPSTHRRPSSHGGIFDIPGSVPVRPIKIDAYDVDVPLGSTKSPANSLRIEGRTSTGLISQAPQTSQHVRYRADLGALRVLIVEVSRA